MHTGGHARVTVRPAAPGRGIIFVAGTAIVPASADSVLNTRRCTTLGIRESQISTVEHLLAALRGLEVDNAEIHVDGGEIPILDGSAREWVDALESVGIAELGQPAPIGVLKEPIALGKDDWWMVAAPAERLTITCVTSFDHPQLGTEVVTYLQNPRAFTEEIAPARTFGFIEEVEALRSAGLALGGSLDNALIVYPDRFSSELRLPNECSRHKLLDLVGDLSLAGGPFAAAITAIKPSHRANVEFARLLSAHLRYPTV